MQGGSLTLASRALNEKRPWKENPNYFKRVRISAVALLKMVMHARSGGSLEIMGLMVYYLFYLHLLHSADTYHPHSKARSPTRPL